MIDSKEKALAFEKQNRKAFNEANELYTISYNAWMVENLRTTVAIRVGVDFEYPLIEAWLKQARQFLGLKENDNKAFSMGTVFRMILVKLEVIQDPHLAVMWNNKFDKKFLDYIDKKFPRVDTLVLKDEIVRPFDKDSKYYEKFKVESSYKNITVQIDPFIKDLWTKYISDKPVSGTYIVKQELVRMGIYPQNFFDTVIIPSSVNRKQPTIFDEDGNRTEKTKRVHDKSLSFGIACSGVEAQRFRAFQEFFKNNNISIADLVKYELIKQKALQKEEFERIDRNLNKFKNGMEQMLKELYAAQRERQLAKYEGVNSFIYTINFPPLIHEKIYNTLQDHNKTVKEFVEDVLTRGGWVI